MRVCEGVTASSLKTRGPFDCAFDARTLRGLTLVPYNVCEFERIPGLSTENWHDAPLARSRCRVNSIVESSSVGDLFRHYAIMSFKVPRAELRELWVDKIFLPLVWPANHRRSRAR